MTDTPRWSDRIEATRARLWLLGCVLPRAVSASIAAAKQADAVAPELTIPSWELGAREFGETATDELFVALSAMYRKVPSTDEVRASVDACNRVVTTLGGPRVDRTLLSGHLAAHHAAPGPLRILGLRRRKIAGIEHEHLEYASEPTLPAPICDEGYGAPEVAHARLFRHEDGDRPWVVFIHGAEQGRFDDVWTFRAKHLHHDLGLNVAMPVLPAHGPRRELGVAWPSLDLVGNIANMMRAVSDVRALVGWIDAGQTHPDISVIGMSLGGPIAALVAGLDPAVNAVAATVPMLDAHATIAHHTAKTGGRGKVMAEMISSTPVHTIGGLVDPLALVPHAQQERRLVVAALGDRMTSVRTAAKLHARWRGDIHWHHGGHVWHLASGDVQARIDQFLTARPARVRELSAPA